MASRILNIVVGIILALTFSYFAFYQPEVLRENKLIVTIAIISSVVMLLISELIPSKKRIESVQENNLNGKKKFRVWDESPSNERLVGRIKEVTLLKKAISAHKPVIIVSGEPGIGKTTLVSSVVKAIESSYRIIIWQSFLRPPNIGLMLDKWLAALCLHSTSQYTLDKLDIICEYIRQHKAIIVLDNFDMSHAKIDSETTQQYNELFNKLAVSVDCGSVIITSTTDLPLLIDSYRGSIARIPLDGLKESEICELAQSLYTISLQKSTAEHISGEANGNPQLARIVFDLAVTAYSENVDDAINALLSGVSDGPAIELLRRQIDQLVYKDKLLIFLLTLWRQPVDASELISWMPMSGVSFLDIADTESTLVRLVQRQLLRRDYDGRYSLKSFTLNGLTLQIRKQIVNHIMGSELWKEINHIALAHAKWPENIKQEISRQIFEPAIEMLRRIASDPSNCFHIDGLLDRFLNNPGGDGPFSVANYIQLKRLLNYEPIQANLLGRSLRGTDFQSTLLFNTNLEQCSISDVVFSGSNGPIYTIDASATDHNLIAIGLASGNIEIRKVDDGTVLNRIEAHIQPIRYVQFWDYKKAVVTGSEDGSVILWYFETNHFEILYRHKSWVWDGDILNEYLATAASDSSIIIYNLVAKTTLTTLLIPTQRVWCISWHKNEVICAGEDGIIWISKGLSNYLGSNPDVSSTEISWVKLKQYDSPIKSLSIRYDTVAIGLKSGFLTILNIENVSSIDIGYMHKGAVRTIEWIDEKVIISCGDDGFLKLINIEENILVKVLTSGTSRLWKMKNIPGDVNRIVSVGDDSSIRIWSPIKSDFPIKSWLGYGQAIRTFDSNKNYLLLGCSDDFLRVVDLISLETIKLCPLPRSTRVLGAYFLSDADIVVSLHTGQLAFIDDFETSTWREPRFRLIEAHEGSIESICVSPSRNFIATGGEDRIIRIWNKSGTLLKELKDFHTSRIWSLTFSEDEKTIISAGGDFKIVWWDIATSNITYVGEGHTNLIFSIHSFKGNKIISGGADQTIRVWENGKEILKRSIPDLVRCFISLKNQDKIFYVGRSYNVQEGWIIGECDFILGQMKRSILGKLNGSARAVIQISQDLILLGGEYPYMIKYDMINKSIVEKKRVTGPYEGTTISKGSIGLSPRLQMTLEFLGIKIV